MTKKTSWDFSALYSSDSDLQIEKDIEEVKAQTEQFVSKWKDRDDYLENPKILAEALNEYNLWQEKYGTAGKFGYYFDLRTSQDQLDTNLKARENQITEKSIKNQTEIQFFELKIAKIPQSEQSKFLNEPPLAPYKHFLEMLFEQSKYLLTEPEEKILALKSQTSFANWVKMTSTFLSKEERDILQDDGTTQKQSFEMIFNTATNSKSEKVRDQATVQINQILEKYKDVAEQEINSVLQDKKTNDQLRGRSRPDSSRHSSDDIDTTVVDALIEAVSSRNDIARRIYKLKAKLLKKDKLKYNERNLEYGQISKSYSFDQSIELVDKVFKKLDPEFSEILNRFITAGQFDVFPTKGKRGGAFCSYNLLSQPTFVMLNHTDKLNDVLTIAHEMGHAINNELMRKKQNALNFGTPTSTAEVASTFMEDFVLQELMLDSDHQTKLSLMVMKLNDDVSSIFRQIACYKFEQDLHREFRDKGYLSSSEIGQLFQNNMSSYMGEFVDQPEWAQNWWIYWSHIRYFFYVYSYAGGLLISKSLQSSVKKDHQFIQKVKEFLSSGTSDSPKNIFKKMDIDISDKNFWNKGLNEIEELLKETEELYNKLNL